MAVSLAGPTQSFVGALSICLVCTWTLGEAVFRILVGESWWVRSGGVQRGALEQIRQSQHNLPSFRSCDFCMHFLKQITLISREEKMKDTKSNIVEN